MYRVPSVFALLLLMVGDTAGQTIVRPFGAEEAGATAERPFDHVTDELMKREDAHQALEAYHTARESGRLAAAKTASPPLPLGSEFDFYVYVNQLEDREKRTFVKQYDSDVADIWVAKAELDQVSPAMLDALAEQLLRTTPEGSFNPLQGIVKNDNDIFGSAPDVDGDGRVDILFYDIEDRVSGVSIAGYVTSIDLCTSASAPVSGCGTSNERDVLYLDTNPLLTFPLEQVFATAAHEYQHLIHYAYHVGEETFVNEGLSMWAERANGYAANTIGYLGNENERNQSLFIWRSESAEVHNDYDRADLFTSYLAERLGPLSTGAIARDTRRGEASYRAALETAGLTLEDVLLEFHAANLWNDSSDRRYGYTNPNLSGLRANVPSSRTINGETARETPEATLGVLGGGSLYVRWENVTDFNLRVSVDSVGTISRYGQARALVGLKRVGSGNTEFVRLNLGLEPTFFSGDFESITLVASHVFATDYRIVFRYSAEWRNNTQLSSETIQYDNGNWRDPFFALGRNGRLATRFVRTDRDAVLTRIWVSPFYLSNFSNGGQSEGAARDFRLTIAASNGNDLPGEALLSKDVTDPREYSPVLTGQTGLTFVNVDFDPAELPALPDTLFVVLSDAGTDQNRLVVGVSTYTTENVSFIYDPGEGGSWSRIWDVSLVDDNGTVVAELNGTAVPIRAEFVSGLTVDVEASTELPTTAALDQNYPNPFNPATSITYQVPAGQHVRLVVYDLTGRAVVRLVDEFVQAGSHTVAFDGRSLASGVYFYTLETTAGRLTRKMSLVK